MWAPTPEFCVRFWAKVNKTDTCWLWTGARQRKYGKMRGRTPDHRAHRISWEIAYGPIPEDLVICHTCDVPLCVRPDHLFLGTRADNLADMTAKGRRVRGEASSKAILTEADVRFIRSLSFLRGDQKRFARAYGVSHATISLIRSRTNWRHL